VIELNPYAIELAEKADAMLRGGATAANFPLLGIPLLLRDNIDTGDRMQTTAGSFALRREKRQTDESRPRGAAQLLKASEFRGISRIFAP
jgi:amidase